METSETVCTDKSEHTLAMMKRIRVMTESTMGDAEDISKGMTQKRAWLCCVPPATKCTEAILESFLRC